MFDFWRGISGPAGAHSVSQLTDCSNADYYCLREREFSVALPKICRTMNVGDSWAVDGVTTRVITRVTLPGGPHHMPMYEHDGFALASDGHDAVFLYDPPYGVLSIHPGARTVAEVGQFSAQGSSLPVLALVSPDSFGPCRRAR